MQSIKKIIMLVAGGLIIIGIVIALLAYALVGFKWNAFNTSRALEEKSYTYNLSEVSSLTISELDADLIIVGTDDDRIKIDCYESENDSYNIQLLGNGNLSVNRDRYEHWYKQIGFNFNNQPRTVTVSIPRKFNGDIETSTMSGKISMSDFNGLNAVNSNTASGDINLKNLIVNNDVSASTISGNVDLSNISTGKDMNMETASGEIQFQQGKTDGNLAVSAVSGALNFSDITIKGDTSFENASGNVDLNKFAGNRILISTISGNVLGQMIGDPANYAITADSISGKIDVPHSGLGENSFDISTSSGNIDIEFTAAN